MASNPLGENLTNWGIPKRRQGQVSPVKLAHIVLKTPRYREMVDWWVKVLEAEASITSQAGTFLTYDDEHHRLAILNAPHLDDPDPLAAGLGHVSFTYADLHDLVFTYERLKKEGILPCWCINHGITTSFYYEDPDGTRVELQIDNFDTIEETNAFFASDDCRRIPGGVEFDPDILAAKLHAGVPISELLKWDSTRELAPA